MDVAYVWRLSSNKSSYVRGIFTTNLFVYNPLKQVNELSVYEPTALRLSHASISNISKITTL